METTKCTPAGFWLRLAASLVDDFIFSLIVLILVLLASVFLSAEQSAALFDPKNELVGLSFAALFLLYKAGFEASVLRASPGKRIVGIAVVNSSSQQISLVRAVLRNFLKAVSFIIFGFGFLMAAFPGQKRCLHDILSGCYVIRQR